MLASLLRFPIPAPAFTDETLAQFAGPDGTFKGKPPPTLASQKQARRIAREKLLSNQVHPDLRRTISFQGRNPVWDARVFDVLGNSSLAGLSPPAYPHAATDLMLAIETVRETPGFAMCGRKSRCLVVSSITPWIETMLLPRFCATVRVLDFNPPIIADGRFGNRLRSISPDEVGSNAVYDLVVSFSGIEHSGLTRYGDMPNPTGDISTGADLASKLRRRGGCAFLGLPLAASTDIVWPAHRLYGRPRFREVTRDFARQLGFVWDGKVLLDPFDPSTILHARLRVADWQYQPVAMLAHDENTTFLLPS